MISKSQQQEDTIMCLNEERAKQIMEKYDLDALVASAPENVTYSSNHDYTAIYRYKYGRMQTYVIIPRDKDIEPALIVPIDHLAYLADRPSWIKDIRAYGTFYIYGRDSSGRENYTESERRLDQIWEHCAHSADAFESLAKALRDKGLAKGKRIGIDEMNITSTIWEKVCSEFPKLEIAKAFGIFKEIRMVKSPAEIEMLTKSIETNDRALGSVINMIEEGVSEKELIHWYKTLVTEQGGSHGFWTTAAGTRGGALFPPIRHSIKKGDLIRIDAGCLYKRYWSDTARTAVIGSATDRAKRYYEAIHTGIKEGAQLLKPGTKVADVFNTIVSTVRKVGIKHYQRHHCGHSMGLETYEPPMIVSSSESLRSDIHLSGPGEIRLEENMIINLEAPYYEMGFGGLQFEETYLIRRRGAQRLTSLNEDMYVI